MRSEETTFYVQCGAAEHFRYLHGVLLFLRRMLRIPSKEQTVLAHRNRGNPKRADTHELDVSAQSEAMAEGYEREDKGRVIRR